MSASTKIPRVTPAPLIEVSADDHDAWVKARDFLAQQSTADPLTPEILDAISTIVLTSEMAGGLDINYSVPSKKARSENPFDGYASDVRYRSYLDHVAPHLLSWLLREVRASLTPAEVAR